MRALVEQLAHLDAKAYRQLLYQGDGGVALPPFEIADVGAVDACLEGELLLAQALLAAELTQVLGKALTDIHTADAAAT